MSELNEGMKTEILEELTSELRKEPTFDSAFLKTKVSSVYREVKRIRKYPSYYKTTQIESDMEQFYDVIKSVVLFDFNQRGIEFQTSSTENSVTAQFVDRNSLFKGVISLS